jgi:hypothetical protein
MKTSVPNPTLKTNSIPYNEKGSGDNGVDYECVQICASLQTL